MTGTPNFTGWRAIILSEEDGNTERLVRQLGVLGLKVRCDLKPLQSGDLPDLVIIDADRGWDELLPWSDARPACPVVALLGSEAPGRIVWALKQGTGAIIAKPVNTSVIYPALVMALSIHQERIEAERTIAHLEERLRLRPVVFAAMAKLKSERRVEDDEAFAILRDCAMRRRLPVEQIAAFFLGGSEPLREVG